MTWPFHNIPTVNDAIDIECDLEGILEYLFLKIPTFFILKRHFERPIENFK
jgi:hypothetical protein